MSVMKQETGNSAESLEATGASAKAASTTPAGGQGLRRLSKDEWMAEGTRLFGPDMMTWRFVCPICKAEQSVEDFRKFKDKGAQPSDAYFNCIGRFMDLKRSAFNANPTPQTRCDYSMGGLIRLALTVVIHEDGKESYVFEFAPPSTASASAEPMNQAPAPSSDHRDPTEERGL